MHSNKRKVVIELKDHLEGVVYGAVKLDWTKVFLLLRLAQSMTWVC